MKFGTHTNLTPSIIFYLAWDQKIRLLLDQINILLYFSINIWSIDKIFSWLDTSCSPQQLLYGMFGLKIEYGEIAHS